MSSNRQARRRAARAAERARKHESRPPARAQSLSRGQRAVRELDGYHGLRSALAELAQIKHEWAGLPMPLEGQRLIVERTFPYAEKLMAIGAKEEADDDGWRVRNSWFSLRHRCDIILMEKDGKIEWGKLAAFHHIAYDLSSLGCSDVWGLEQEGAAVKLLGTMVRHRAFKQYLLTGMFLERSQRSGVTYVFRRLKPTIALAADGRGGMKILAALCMHPIAYYEGSWAGSMVPTDDVIAHLSLMRGDEHMFWKRCNQHPAWRPEAGL